MYALKKQITIAPEVTDNFGNRLINKNNYIPTVLAITDAASESEKAQFSNVLSKFQKTDTFKYHAVTSTGVHQL
jgi:3-dehydroquinate dehydratase